MRLMEFGTENKETVILLHGGGLSWWNYREAAQLLQGQYHVVIPILDGHSGSEEPFASIEENAKRIIDYIDQNCGGRVNYISGLSLGGQIALEILGQRPDICRNMLVESAVTKPMWLTWALVAPAFSMSYGLIKQPWFARMQAAYLGIPKELFDDYYRDTCQIKKADMIAFMKANSCYRLKPGLEKTWAKVKMVYGSRERRILGKSAKLAQEIIPGCKITVLPWLRHGELSLSRPKLLVDLLMSMRTQ